MNSSSLNELLEAIRDGSATEDTIAAASVDLLSAADPVSGETALHVSVSYSRAEVVRALLERGVEVNATQLELWTALHLVSDAGDASLARTLIAHGADVHMKTIDGATALHLACWKSHLEAALILLDSGADPNAEDNRAFRPLHVARDVAIAELLLRRGANVAAQTKFGFTALHCCAEQNSVAVAALLCNQVGVDVNATDAEGVNSLRIAVRRKHRAFVRVLLNSGRAVCDPLTLNTATWQDDCDTLRLLIRHGADLNAIASDCLCPLQIAAIYQRHASAVELLLAGARPDTQSTDGTTALHHASRQSERIAALLLDFGADSTIVSASGRSTTNDASGTCAAMLLACQTTMPPV